MFLYSVYSELYKLCYNFELFNEKNQIDFESRNLSELSIFSIGKIYYINFLHIFKEIKDKIKSGLHSSFHICDKILLLLLFHFSFSIIMYRQKTMYLGKIEAYHQHFCPLCDEIQIHFKNSQKRIIVGPTNVSFS